MATDNNNNNIFINSFIKGMNTDVSPILMSNLSYRFGLNIRITQQNPIYKEINQNYTSGSVAPVPKGKLFQGIKLNGCSILATNSVQDLGIVITGDEKGDDNLKPWHLYIVKRVNDLPVFTEVLTNINNKYTNKNRISTVLTTDAVDCIKLFIADGIHPIIAINIHEDNIEYLNSLTNVDQIVDRYLYPSEQIILNKKCSGNLPVSIIQYSYRFFKKNGTCSKISPLTKRFYTLDYDKSKETGNANGTPSSIGYELKVPLILGSINFSDVFDYCQLFRIQQGGESENIKKDSEGNEIKETGVDVLKAFLIQEFKIPKHSDNIIIKDTGMKPLQLYSIEEYNAFVSLTVTPQYISFLQGSLFAANIQDESIIEDESLFLNSHTVSLTDYDLKLVNPIDKNDTLTVSSYNDYTKLDKSIKEKYYLHPSYDINEDNPKNLLTPTLKHNGNPYIGGQSKWVTWRLVAKQVPVYDNYNYKLKLLNISSKKKNFSATLLKQTPSSIVGAESIDEKTFIESLGVGYDCINNTNHQDSIYTSLTRSLRRGEVYRYGIIYYTKYGTRTDVQWIDDIRIPSLKEIPPSLMIGNTLCSINLGLRFDVNVDNEDYIYYQIVRCPKYKEWSKTLYQVVCSHPMKHTTPSIASTYSSNSDGNTEETEASSSSGRYSPWLPNPYICDQYLKYVNCYWASTNNMRDAWSGYTNNENSSLINTAYPTSKSEDWILLMFSEDINVALNNVYNILQESDCYLHPAYTYAGLNYYELNDSISNFTAFDNNINSNWLPLWSNNSFVFGDCNLGESLCLKYQYCISGDSDMEDPLFFNTDRTRSDYFYLRFNQNRQGNWMQDANTSYGDSNYRRECLGIGPSMDAVIKNRTGYAFTPTLWCDTCYYDAQVTHLSQGTVCSSDKAGYSITHYYDYNKDNNSNRFTFVGYPNRKIHVKSFGKVKEPGWEQGFTNITLDGTDVKTGSKAYKGHTSTVGGNNFCNWVSSAMYDLRLSLKQTLFGVSGNRKRSTSGGMFAAYYTNLYGTHYPSKWTELAYGDGSYNSVYTSLTGTLEDDVVTRSSGACGWIGPGTRCILAAIPERYSIMYDNNEMLSKDARAAMIRKEWNSTPAFTCTLTNIQHGATNYSGVTRDQLQFSTYYGFGNYGKCDGTPLYVFDGDIFITPAEFTPIHKTYDFQSLGDTIPSAQVNQFVLMESEYNSFFDYGYNFRNTQSDNIQLEPCDITGICSQDRPQYQLNAVFASNNVTIESYTASALEMSNKSFPTRIFYGNDDDIQTTDSRTLFQANNYADVGSEYGEITNIHSYDNSLYYWQQHAFGKLAVKERSLVVDTNSNTVQLGQGEVLQRHDYLSISYGMPPDTCCETFADNKLLWYDPSAVAIIGYIDGKVTELSSILGVANSVSSYYDNNANHTSSYDIQNKEILFNSFSINKNQALLVYNTQNLFTSYYTRLYDDCLQLNGILYSIKLNNDKNSEIRQLNYLSNVNAYLLPTILSFVVNGQPQSTKVFDVQQINTVRRNYNDDFVESFMLYKTFKFETNLYTNDNITSDILSISDREGNIQYVIPRLENSEYGNRMRGTYMEVTMTDNAPKYDYTISNIITKFRQSFS